jgi:hypothetical protein
MGRLAATVEQAQEIRPIQHKLDETKISLICQNVCIKQDSSLAQCVNSSFTFPRRNPSSSKLKQLSLLTFSFNFLGPLGFGHIKRARNPTWIMTFYNASSAIEIADSPFPLRYLESMSNNSSPRVQYL